MTNEQIEELIVAGKQLANIAHNLGKEYGQKMTPDRRAAMAGTVQVWDTALSTLRAAASAPKAELTDKQIADAAYEEFGIVADDREVVAFSRWLLAQAAPVAAPSTLQELADWLRTSDLLTDIGYRALLNGDTMDANLSFLLRFTQKLAAAPAAPVAAAVPAGWVKNGGWQPVADDVLVAVVYADEGKDIDKAENFDWETGLARTREVSQYFILPAAPAQETGDAS